MHEVQALYLRHLSAAAETRYVDGPIAVRTGILSNTENGVVSTTAELDRRTVHGLIEWLGDVHASWIALEPTLGTRLAAAGATPENDAWMMRGYVGVRKHGSATRGRAAAPKPFWHRPPEGSRMWRALGFRAEPQPPGYWYYLPNPNSS